MDFRKVEYVVSNGIKRKVSSQVWNQFHQIFKIENNNDIKNWFICLLCHEAVLNKYSGTTTVFHRHILKHCLKKVGQNSEEISRTNVCTKHISALKEAATQYVCDDLRPYSAIEGSGLFQLMYAALELGKSYATMTAVDLKRIVPSRQTTKRAVEDKIPSVKSMISEQLLEAIATSNGFACTVDLWSDKYRQMDFLAMTAHINLVRKSIIPKRLVIGFKGIEEESKTTDVVIRYMYDILLEYGLTPQEIDEKVDFVSDRGSQFLAMHGIRRSNCFAHIINNIVEKICSDHVIQVIIDDCKKLVKYLKKSHLNYRHNIVVKSFCKTRWNTVYTTLHSVLNSYQGI